MNGLRISEERKKLGLSQEELADKVGVSQKSISKYERGNRRPTYETLTAMSKLFGVSIDYLLGNSDEWDGMEQSEPVYTTQAERDLLEIYRDYEDHGFSDKTIEELKSIFPEIQCKKKKPSTSEEKILLTFSELNEDNQDIIIGKAKELLREQHYNEPPVAAEGLRKASGK